MGKLEKSFKKIIGESVDIETKLISAFPGCGKSHFFRNSDKTVLDSDSSTFDKSEFPENYMEHIGNKLGTVDYIMISSHKEVRDALKEKGFKYTLVYPNKENKTDYLKRYEERGSPKSFIKLLSDNWDQWIGEMDEESYPKKIVLNKGEYLSDVINKV